MSWFKRNKEGSYPDYWISYLNLFKEKTPATIAETSFVVLDTETTGFDFELDRIISIGALIVKQNEIAISDTFEIYIKQRRFNPETVEIHGILKNEKLETVTAPMAIELFLTFIGNSVLVAHHAHFDITMINRALQRHGFPKLRNNVLDTAVLYRATRIKSNLIDRNKQYSLDEVAENYGIDVSDRHTAAGDALITAIIFLKTLSLLQKKKVFNLKELLKL
jgi:DNA polymerase-3 subunit epsilon